MFQFTMEFTRAALKLEQVLQLDTTPTDSVASSNEPVHDLWEHARACLLGGRVQGEQEKALRRLASLRHYLLVSDLQAKLLLSLLTAPLESPSADLLQSLRASALLLSCSWLRGVFTSAGGRKRPLPGAVSLQSVVDATRRSLEDRHHSAAYVSEAILLLGLVCVAPACPPELETQARHLILGQLASLQGLPRQLEHLLAGLAYLMTASHGLQLSSVCTGLLSLWSGDGQGVAPTLVDCLRLMHVFQFYRSSLDAIPHSVAISDGLLVLRQFVRAAGGGLSSHACCAAVMVAAGFLRSLSRNNQPEWARCVVECQDIFPLLAREMLPKVAADTSWLTILSSTHVQPDCMKAVPAGDALWVPFHPIDCVAPHVQHCLQCLVLAVAHCGPLPSDPYVSGCLLFVLVSDLLNLSYLHSALLTDASVYVAGSSYLRQLKEQSKHYHGCIMEGGERHEQAVARRGSCTGCELQQLKTRTTNVLFQEARAIVRALCQQYQSCTTNVQSFTLTTLWQHARILYNTRRFFYVSVHLVMPVVETSIQVGIQAVENIFDAASFLCVVFFSLAVDALLAERIGNGVHASPPRELVAPLALDAVSCMELSRRAHRPPYGRLVTSSVHIVAQSREACTALASYMPSYTEILLCPGTLDSSAASYHWDLDEIQAARIFFYLRIIPLCLERLPHHLFESKIASAMFLYMQHPSQELAKACHALFRAFICSSHSPGVENEQIADCQNPKQQAISAKEQLVAFYVKSSLETYPGLTLFDNFVSVMGAIVQHLPPGNPAIVHCINVLVDKYEMLQETASELELILAAEKSDHCRHSDANVLTKAAEDILHLLLHLIPIVDSLVLPELLKVVAKLVLGLRVDGRFTVLRETFDMVVDMDDYTRKPVVVPWLQSLAFLARAENLPTESHVNDLKVLSTISRKAKVGIGKSWQYLARSSL